MDQLTTKSKQSTPPVPVDPLSEFLQRDSLLTSGQKEHLDALSSTSEPSAQIDLQLLHASKSLLVLAGRMLEKLESTQFKPKEVLGSISEARGILYKLREMEGYERDTVEGCVLQMGKVMGVAFERLLIEVVRIYDEDTVNEG